MKEHSKHEKDVEKHRKKACVRKSIIAVVTVMIFVAGFCYVNASVKAKYTVKNGWNALKNRASEIVNKVATISSSDAVVYDANEWDTFKYRTKEEITNKYKESLGEDTSYVNGNQNTYYDVMASTVSPYNPGVLKSDTHSVMTRRTNYYRWLTGADQLTATSSGSPDLQAGALIRKFQFAHQMDIANKPADMSDELWNQGANVNHNILAMGETPRESITLWTNEGYRKDTGLGTIGHRAALMCSNTRVMQFGYAGNVAIGATDYSGHGSKNMAYYAYPSPGYMPLNDIDALNAAWSIELNRDRLNFVSDINGVVVTVTNEANGETYECTTQNGKLAYQDWYEFIFFAQPEANGRKYEAGSKYRVEVNGIREVATGRDAKITYEVNFFDLKDIMPATVTKVETKPWNTLELLAPASIENAKYAEELLPTEAVVKTSTGKEIEIPLNNGWTRDDSRSCFVTHADATDLPANVTDTDHVLDDIKLNYSVSSQYGYIRTKSNKERFEEGESLEFVIYVPFYTYADEYAVYQVVKNDDGTSDIVKRFDMNSPEKTEDEYGIHFTISDIKKSDAGDYFVVSRRGNITSMTDLCHIIVVEKKPASIRIERPDKTTYKIGEDFDVTGGKVYITYRAITLEEEIAYDLTDDMISNFTSESEGKVTVSVTYEGLTDSFDCLIVDGNIDEIDAEYGKTLGDISLPANRYGAFSWVDESTTSVGDIGKNTFEAKYEPYNNSFSSLYDLEVTLNVKKGTPEYDENITLDAVYGDSLSDVVLPVRDNGTYEFEQDGTTMVGDAGVSHAFTLRFVPNDVDRFNTVTGIPVTINISKAIPKFDIPTGLEAGYNDKLSDVILPECFYWEDAEQSVGNVGVHKFKARYVPKDTNNYEIVEGIDIDVSVTKATPEYEKDIVLYATYGDTLEKIVLPSADNGVYSFEDETTTPVGEVGEHFFNVIFTPNDDNFRTVTIKAKVIVEKAEPQFTVPENLEASYGDTLSSVVLPELENGRFEWMDEPDKKVGNAGENKFLARFIPNDTNNYNIVQDIEITITVKKIKPSFVIPSDLVVEYGKKLSDVKLPDGFYWVNENESVGEVGEKTFAGYFVPDDETNYEIEYIDIPLKVVKAKPTFTIPENLEATYGDILSSVELPHGFTWNTPDIDVGNAGIHTFYAKYTPDDTINYTDVENVEIKVKVNKKMADNIVLPVIDEITYDENRHLSDIILPDGWRWEDGTIIPEVNNTGYRAIYTPKDELNYDYSNQDLRPLLTVKVNKARPVFDIPHLNAYKDDTLSDIVLPKLSNGTFVWQDAPETSVGNVGTHTFMVTFIPNDTKNYETVKNIEAIVEVGKAKPTFTIPENLEATYGDILSSVELPHGFTWNTPDVSVGDAGNNVFLATYTPDDIDNYSIVTNIEITVHVNKKKAEKLEIPVFEDMVYDENRHLSDIILPDGWRWEDDTIVPTVNNDGYTAIYTPVDTKNYDYSDENLTPKIKLNIIKADPKYTIPEHLIIPWGTNIKDMPLPDGWFAQEDVVPDRLGISTYKFKYVPEDTENYNIVYDVEIDVEVVKAYPMLTVPDDITVYEGEYSTLSDIELPDGWNWKNGDIALEEEGYYEVVFTPEDIEHYYEVNARVYVNILPKEEVVDDETANQENSTIENGDINPNTGDSFIYYIVMLIVFSILSLNIFKNTKEE